MFHGIRDLTVLPGDVFLKLAWRLTAYEGAMHNRALAVAAKSPGAAEAAPPQATAGGAPVTPGARQVPATKAALQGTREFAGIFSFGKSG